MRITPGTIRNMATATTPGAARARTERIPQTISQIFNVQRGPVMFENFVQITCTQEFVLQWSSDGGRSFREVVRRMWTSAPACASYKPLRMSSEDHFLQELRSRLVLPRHPMVR